MIGVERPVVQIPNGVAVIVEHGQTTVGRNLEDIADGTPNRRRWNGVGPITQPKETFLGFPGVPHEDRSLGGDRQFQVSTDPIREGHILQGKRTRRPVPVLARLNPGWILDVS